MGETAEKWASWLQQQLDERGWKQADLVRASGGLVKRDRASKWLRGAESPTHRLAVTVANALDVSHGEALRAAGFDVLDTPSGVQARGRTETLVASLDDIERQLPRQILVARLARYTQQELLAELQRRVSPAANVGGQGETPNVTHLRPKRASETEEERELHAAFDPDEDFHLEF